ncbi:MAG TPA: RHS repeat-associated core domain-containing protein [Candidatus Kapabacteria bacterium]|nr:RHS repeat-associated core domain-containing protein [Candidatus Kapabacteria bacterium]
MLSAGGVRKYDYEIGRFTSVDLLWEKYTGWTGYQYTRNNPINRIDYNGMDDGQFGSWMQVGPMQELILGDKNVNTYQEIIENSEKLANKQLINAWAEIGLMGLTGVATDVALSSPFAAKYLSRASNYIKGLLGFGDDGTSLLADASKSAFKAADNPSSIFIKNKHLSDATGNYAKFATTDVKTAQGWVQKALRSQNARFLPNDQIPNTFQVISNIGTTIGTKGQTSIRVIVNYEGKVINAFPVN